MLDVRGSKKKSYFYFSGLKNLYKSLMSLTSARKKLLLRVKTSENRILKSTALKRDPEKSLLGLFDIIYKMNIAEINSET